MTLRLTLRTLLSYLDDTLEPSQAKTIGAKVTESEQARELIERIKQVTRRRRLTTPPPTGPGGIDPNTIAEYLDNDVTAEKAAEVEQICLASDVHLAEVAACHQILTLVLGEPALVPPSAKQKMYALVKGPEAIHSRKPTKPASKPELDLSSEIEPDQQDETLRMGVPAVGGKGNSLNVWLLVGGGAIAACLLFVAVWQLIRPAGNQIVEPKGEQIAQADGKETTSKVGMTKNDAPPRPIEDTKKKEVATINPVKDPPNKKTTNPIEIFQPVPADPADEEATDIPYKKFSMQATAMGKYIPAESSVLLQMKPDKSGWMRLTAKNAPVGSVRPLVSLPGSKSLIALNSGIELTLWGNLPEETLVPDILESRVTLHASDVVATDFTLERGRVIIKNNSPSKKIVVRVRFMSPTTGAENHFDITLFSRDAAVVVERTCTLERTTPQDQAEPFFEDPKDPDRKGPTATMKCYALANSANIRYGQDSYTIDPLRSPMLVWQSRQNVLGPPKKLEMALPYWFKEKGTPVLKDKEDLFKRETAQKAQQMLIRLLDDGKQIYPALVEMVDLLDKEAKREASTEKRISMQTYFGWRHAFRCYMAIDDIEYLYGELARDNTPMIVRGLLIQTLYQWLGTNRDHDYQLLDMLRKTPYKYKQVSAVRIMELLHYISEDEARKPGKYQQLIDGLNSDLFEIRILSHWHLVGLAPVGAPIPYDPIGPAARREEAIRAWRDLIPPGKLPPPPPGLKKDKG